MRVSSKPRRGGLWQWLGRGEALREARARSHGSDLRRRELVLRARSAAELGDRVFDALEPLPTGPAKHIAADLYRQSVYWCLLARGSDVTDKSLDGLWESSKCIEGLKLPSDAGHRKELDALMRSHDFRTLAELSEAERARAAEGLRALAYSTLDLLEPADRAVRKLLFQRFVRITGLILMCSVLAASLIAGVQHLTRKPNLALGKPWRASSVWAECHPEIRSCGGLRSDIFFHTKDDESPWVEFDLGTLTSISEVYVKNRSDSVPDRAVPLVIEVSDDGKSWREVARKNDTFRTWTASFAPVMTRYVRARVDRRSWLHLDRVEIRP